MGLALTKIQVATKCNLGQGALCCRYLTVSPAGFACAETNQTEKTQIEMTASLGGFTAKSGPCADPSDETSVAVPYVSP